MDITIKKITYGTDEYETSIDIRNESFSVNLGGD